jgi:hypothetical protein
MGANNYDVQMMPNRDAQSAPTDWEEVRCPSKDPDVQDFY